MKINNNETRGAAKQLGCIYLLSIVLAKILSK